MPAGTIPLVIFTGITLNKIPLQLVVVILVTAGAGLTVTVTVNVAPVQPPDNGVTVYVAVCAVFVGLLSVPLIFAAAAPAAPPVKPPVTAGMAQLYVVPPGTISAPFTGVTVKAVPPQVVATLFAIVAFGFTVTVTVKFAPVQPPDNGVTVYVAVCGEFVGLVNVPLILAADVPVAPPVSPPVTEGAGHE